jgi:streptogramin lyase
MRLSVTGTITNLAIALAIVATCRDTAAAAYIARLQPHTNAPAIHFSLFGGRVQSLTPAPDGSLWALSLQPAGAAKHVLHYVNGTWTQMPWFATEIAIAADGTVYLDDSVTGGVYAYDGKTLTPQLSSKQPAVWVSPSTTTPGFYMLLKNGSTTGNYPVYFKAPGKSAVYQYLSASASQIVATPDLATYTIPSVGTIAPYAFFTLSASGTIGYYPYNVSSSTASFPVSASAIVPVPGGFFGLKSPQSASGAQLYYFDYGSNTTTLEPYYFTSIASYITSGGPQTLFAIDSTGRIWSTPFTPTRPQVSIELFGAPTADDITAGPDSNLWYTAYGGAIGKITTAGKSTLYPIPTPKSDPCGITLGPDGNLWFTEGAGKVGKITSSGAITEYSTTMGNGLGFITIGPDGALWFEDHGIGRITTAGAYTEHIVSSVSGPIVSGPDGALWFGQEGDIGRIVTNGAITEYALDGGDYSVDYMTVGPDGAIYFTGTPYRVGRITMAGAISYYDFQSMRGTPTGIATGPDGAIWFNDSAGSRLARLTTSGTLTEFPPAADIHGFIYPVALAVGPDGNLWFTGDREIGRATLR